MGRCAMIRVACPKCALTLGVNEAQAGGLACCPKCGQQFRVPAIRPAAPPVAAGGSAAPVRPHPPAPPRKKPEPATAPPRAARGSKSPVRRSAPAAPSRVGRHLGAFLVFLVLGVGLGVLYAAVLHPLWTKTDPPTLAANAAVQTASKPSPSSAKAESAEGKADAKPVEPLLTKPAPKGLDPPVSEPKNAPDKGASIPKDDPKQAEKKPPPESAVKAPPIVPKETKSEPATSPVQKAAVVFKGHQRAVTCLAFARDGKSLASGSNDKTVIIWNLDTNEPRLTLQPKYAVHSVGFAANDHHLVTGGMEASNSDGPGRVGWRSEVLLWDLRTGKLVRAFDAKLILIEVSPDNKLTLGNDSPVVSLALSADGETMAVGLANEAVQLFETGTGKKLPSPIGVQRNKQLYGVAMAPDGKTLAIAGLFPNVHLASPDSDKKLAVLHGHKDDTFTYAVLAAAFSSDGALLATGSEDRTAAIWHVASGKRLATMQGHQFAISSLAFSPDSALLATGRRFAEPTEGRFGKAKEIAEGDKKNLTATVMPARDAVKADEVKIWDVRTSRELAALKGCGVVAFSPDSKKLATGNLDGTIQIWDVAELVPGLSQAPAAKGSPASPPTPKVAAEPAGKAAPAISPPAGKVVIAARYRWSKPGAIKGLGGAKSIVVKTGKIDKDGGYLNSIEARKGKQMSVPFGPDGLEIEAYNSSDIEIAIDPAIKETSYAGLRFQAPCVVGIQADGTVIADRAGVTAKDSRGDLWNSRPVTLAGQAVHAFFKEGKAK